MRQFNRARFENEDIQTDANEYFDCVFDHCRLVYTGGPIPVMNDCQFQDTGWFFDDAAGRTVSLIKEFAENVDREIVDSLFGRPVE